MDISEEKLEKLLAEWAKLKRQLSALEQREEDIKKFICEVMDDRKKNMLDTENYQVKRRLQKKSHIKKSDVPTDIWSKYSSNSEFFVYTLKKF